MGRFGSFVLGVVIGALALHTTMNFHVVRTDQGTHLVRKTTPKMSGLYADIRQYDANDWRANPDLARAMIMANRRDLVGQSPQGGLRASLGSVIATVMGRSE